MSCPSCCKPPPLQPQNTRSPLRQCSKDCFCIGVLDNRTPILVLATRLEQFCLPFCKPTANMTGEPAKATFLTRVTSVVASRTSWRVDWLIHVQTDGKLRFDWIGCDVTLWLWQKSFSIERGDRRIFGGLKFLISGFFLVRKFWQVFFWVAWFK